MYFYENRAYSIGHKCNNKNIFIALSGPPLPDPYRSAHVICPWVFNSDTLSLITIIQIATTMTLFNYKKNRLF